MLQIWNMAFNSNASFKMVNDLQKNGVWYREFAKRLIFRDFEGVLKDPFRYVYLFLLDPGFTQLGP